MSGVFCLECGSRVKEMLVVSVERPLGRLPRWTTHNRPCGCHGGVSFDFTDPPERIEQMTQGPGELR